MRGAIVLPLCSALLASVSSVALAQTTSGVTSSTMPSSSNAPPVAQPPGGETTVGEIVVTAQKRSQRINDVGLSITAASGQQLREQNITQVGELTRIEPSLQFSQSNNDTPIYTIRGVGYFEQSLTATPTVSVYQDEVAYTYPSLTKGALLDVERVEVLKGPQGTLYGQNATGGAINFIAARPTSSFTSGADLTYGRFDMLDANAFVSGPLTQDLSARLAFRTEQGGAWQKSVTRDQSLGDKDNYFGRLLLDWKPNEKLKASLNLNGWTDKSENQAGQLEGYHFQAPQYISSLTPGSALPVAPYTQYPVGIQNLLKNPIPPHDDRAADWTAGTRPHNDESYYQGTLRADYQFSPALVLTSISNYEHYHEHDLRDLSGVNVANVRGLFAGTVTTYSQELRLSGTLLKQRLSYVVGANYDDTRTSSLVNLNGFLQSNSYLTGGSPESTVPNILGFGPFDEVESPTHDHARTASVFGNAEYSLLSKLSVHGGVRFTESDQNTDGCTIDFNPGLDLVLNTISKREGGSGGAVPGGCSTLGPDHNPGLQRFELNQSNVPWQVGANYHPIRDTLVYVTVTKGYKAGSSPSLGAETYVQLQPVNQESVLSYEVGAKSSLLHRTLQINAAAFHYDYSDKQFLGRIADPIFVTLQSLVNVPRSTVDGAELSLAWRPIGGLTLNAAATYLDSEVTSHFVNYSPYTRGANDTIDLKGESFPFTPKWSLQAGARYERTIGNGLKAFASASGSYRTKTVGAFGAREAATEGPPLDIKAYGLLDMAAGVETDDGRWKVQVWGKNVTNTYYWTTAFYEADTTVRYTGLPATYGLTVSYRY